MISQEPQLEKDELVFQMHEHALVPRAQEFTERAVTKAIFELFAHLDADTQQLTWMALLSGVDAAKRNHVIAGETLWSWDPRANPGPDFGALNPNNDVRVVVEHKRYAKSNPTSYGKFIGRKRFDDPVAQSYVVPKHTTGQHTPEQCLGCEDSLWHTAIRKGKFAAGMPQIDFYRCTPDKWVRRLEDGGEAHLSDPTKVLWILLDSRGRSAAEAFPGAHTAAEWYTTSYDDFAAGLWKIYERALVITTADDHEATDHLGGILEMIVYP